MVTRAGVVAICIGALTVIGVLGVNTTIVLGVRFSSSEQLKMGCTDVDGMLFPIAICVKGSRGASVSVS